MTRTPTASAALALIAAVLGAPALARANPDGLPPRPDTPAPSATSYAGQVVLADLAGVVGTGLMLSNTRQVKTSFAPVLLASPIVHLVHGNPGKAAASLLLNVGVPLAGAFLTYSLDRATCTPSDNGGCGPEGAVPGALLGFLIAVVLDASLLAHESPAPAPAPARPSLAPSLSLSRAGGGTIGLTGNF